jgi:hypothetical protein
VARVKPCKDCASEAGGAPLIRPRPAPHPGPRCTTHHRIAVAAAKARAHDRHVAKTYGLAPGAYELLHAYQGGRCAICQKATGKARRLAVDHDHQTGEVRGLLCKPCNYVLLGRYGADALARAIAYLADPPARRAL